MQYDKNNTYTQQCHREPDISDKECPENEKGNNNERQNNRLYR